MPAATGAPETLRDRREELTPMLRQYVDLCEAYDDALVLFRVGDFYKAFCEAAEEVARVCELTRIEREDSTGTYTACGIPVDNAPTYLEDLLAAGHRLAVADQVEDPDEADGIVDRAVTQVVTPGTVVEDELLPAGENTYVACVAREGGGTGCDSGDVDGPNPEAEAVYAVARVDVSTGECAVTSLEGRAAAVDELDRIGPAELLRGPGVSLTRPCMTTDYDPAAFGTAAARERLAEYVPSPSAVLERDVELRAVGALLAYAEYTQGDDGPLSYVSRIRRYDPGESLRLDRAALRSLELFESRGAEGDHTLFGVVDETVCALGRRRLRSWLRRPSVDRARIEARHDAVEELVGATLLRRDLREHLTAVYDLERLVGRVSRGRADARDLRALAETLAVVPDIRETLADAESDRLVDLREGLPDLAAVRELIDRAVAPDPPQEVTEGGVIREGYDDELDELRATEREGRQWVAELEASERERTGIDSLEVGHNQVHGYYIEVTNANLDRVPDDYVRRQTLKNAERFYTPELKAREDEIFGAAERADALEYDLFRAVREDVAAEADRIQALADALAGLDALASFAVVAVEYDYCRPELGADGIHVTAGRHPVVERVRPEFVPNDADLPGGTLALITGPNMSGKSTYMRQVALTVVLAQAGGFVPADSARLPVVDRVFTRVGASDDIAGGQSTFMREMAELTDILHGATSDSLVLLDEVGRGTSTADGEAIARAAAEFVHDEVGATTLFATHYHDLTDLPADLDRARNLHFAATHEDGEVTFLHRVAEGAASSSYGVEVARMAGVPEPVVERAHELVAEGRQRTLAEVADAVREPPDVAANGHGGDRTEGDRERPDGADGNAPPADLGNSAREVLADIRGLDVAKTTPLAALNLLADYRERLRAGEESNGDESGSESGPAGGRGR